MVKNKFTRRNVLQLVASGSITGGFGTATAAANTESNRRDNEKIEFQKLSPKAKVVFLDALNANSRMEFGPSLPSPLIEFERVIYKGTIYSLNRVHNYVELLTVSPEIVRTNSAPSSSTIEFQNMSGLSKQIVTHALNSGTYEGKQRLPTTLARNQFVEKDGDTYQLNTRSGDRSQFSIRPTRQN